MKEELQNYREKEAELMKCNEDLEKNETRLKTISDADGIKHELESKLEALKVEGSEKMVQIQNYRLNEGKCESAEKLWRDILSNCSIVVNLSDAMKKKFEEKKSLMIEHETSNENLEFVEKQLLGEYIQHSSEKRVLCLMKSSSKTLQNLPYFISCYFILSRQKPKGLGDL